MGALGEPLGNVLGALEGLLEGCWKPLGGVLRPAGSREASKEPPGTTGTRFLRVFTWFYTHCGENLEASGGREVWREPPGSPRWRFYVFSWFTCVLEEYGRPAGASGRRFGGSGRAPGGLLEGISL